MVVAQLVAEEGPESFVLLLHDVGVPEVGPEGGCSLDAGVGKGAYFLAVELVPLSSIKFLVEIQNELGVEEVDEGIAHVA